MTNPTTRRVLLAGAAATGVLAALPVSAGKSGTLHEIEIYDFKFNPINLTVKPGDTIRWTNRDPLHHDATGKDRSWKTKTLRPNKSGKITVTVDMVTDYFCSIHPFMKASLTIVTS
jgi:plastocyanin